ncbi:restriction endonuclease subunit S [Morganella morganii]|uniref:restriction endonuclease subunit S n=1 Tax=Morganella morganii TaxID=582 RepID=UPI0009238B0B|nr:restriction endonuclease subunit S [Morganella morganii]SGD45156.1 Type I restriction enzyme specificity protein MPN_089 [Mycobacterium tuberculosis]MBS9571832.1 restriction endonuclease subunit S [Morganella morganii subsp. morganii]QIM74637.1 restriction endonuclease subunit S [Morganella morganii subsp. morganii]HCR3549695.1 restriction endonuclease subunit S [Morganella morganii]HCR4003043.1 restriction endonuclease subunit S [Morganella morganii]
MSELNYLEKLLDGAEVEWKPLGKVLVRTRGTKITAGQMKILHQDNAPLKIFAGGKTVAFVNFGDIPEKDINREPSIIVKSRGIIEFEFCDKPFSHKNEMWSYHSANKYINIRYVYHYLKLHEVYFQGIGSKMQMPQIAIPDTENYLIPIPCPGNPEKSLAIQSEIVRILDAFTALTAELTAELTARKKQYNYYRDQLLSFNDGKVEWKTLGEIAGYSKARISFDKLNENNYVGVDNLLQNRAGKTLSNYLPTSGNLTKFDIGDILIGNIRPYLKKIWQSDCVGGTNGDVLVIHCSDSSVCSRYLYQVLADDAFFEYNMQHAKGAKMPRGNKEAILKYSVPVPSVTEQTRIVSILDKFDALTNSITEGLPREIELRQKQYEYYRDLLFSFPKPESVNN